MSDVTTDTLPRLLTIEEVAPQLGLSKQRLWQLVRKNQIPHLRLGRAVRISAPQIRDWIEDGGTANGDDPP